MNLAKRLYELQQVDLDLQANLEAKQRVEAQLAHNELLAQARLELKQEQENLAESMKAQQAVEWEIEDIQSKVTPMEEKLYSGSVRNPKELLSLQQETESLKAQVRGKEDKALEIMGQVETRKEKVEQKTKELKQIEKQWKEEKRKLVEDRNELDTAIAASRLRQQSILSELDSTSLELYETLRKGQRQAVARVEQGRCQGCRLVLSTSEIQQARLGEELVQCSNCGRILYTG